MRITVRQMLGTAIGLVTVVLALGVSTVIDVLSYAEPFGYGASGIGIVAGASVMGGLAVLLLMLLIAWRHAVGPRKMKLLSISRRLSLTTCWVIMLICGWLGTFWAIIGIAKAWHWTDILLGTTLLVPACLAAFQIAQE